MYVNQKEDKKIPDIMPFVVGKEKFNKEVKKENDTNPELKLYEPWLQIKSFIMKSVY